MSPVALEALLLVPLALVAGLDAAADCLTTDSRSGKCVLGTQCPQINRIRDASVLQKYLCGFSDNSQMLCCPHRYLIADSKATVGASRPGETAILESNSEDGTESQSLPSIDLSLANTDCWLPSTRSGKCVRGTDCPQINRIRNPTVLETYTCGWAGNSRKLCCPLRYLSEKKDILEDNREVALDGGTLEVPSHLRVPIPEVITGACGKAKVKSRIVGGQDAREGDWPWQALVLRNDSPREMFCGGSLISRKHVLSAAHCVVAEGNKLIPAKNLRVRLGEHDLSKTSPHTIEREVSRIQPHENFNETAFNVNDIALIFMAGDVNFTEYISPICLPYSMEAVPDDIAGRTADVTGWGSLRYKGDRPNILQEVALPISGNRRCWDAYGANYVYVDRERFICAGDSDGQKDSCEGDSGGPLVLLAEQASTGQARMRYYQVGIVSFGLGCAVKGIPGVYTRVTRYLGWINEHL